jgi:hypothetical protein
MQHKLVKKRVQLSQLETELTRQEARFLRVEWTIQNAPVDNVRHRKCHLFHVGDLPHGHVAILDSLGLFGHVVPVYTGKVSVKCKLVHLLNEIIILMQLLPSFMSDNIVWWARMATQPCMHCVFHLVDWCQRDPWEQVSLVLLSFVIKRACGKERVVDIVSFLTGRDRFAVSVALDKASEMDERL